VNRAAPGSGRLNDALAFRRLGDQPSCRPRLLMEREMSQQTTRPDFSAALTLAPRRWILKLPNRGAGSATPTTRAQAEIAALAFQNHGDAVVLYRRQAGPTFRALAPDAEAGCRGGCSCMIWALRPAAALRDRRFRGRWRGPRSHLCAVAQHGGAPCRVRLDPRSAVQHGYRIRAPQKHEVACCPATASRATKWRPSLFRNSAMTTRGSSVGPYPRSWHGRTCETLPLR